jgi:hypothetical protein
VIHVTCMYDTAGTAGSSVGDDQSYLKAMSCQCNMCPEFMGRESTPTYSLCDSFVWKNINQCSA